MNHLNYIIWNADPAIADLGLLTIKWYSVLFLSGFVLSYIIIKRQFISGKVPIDLLDKLTVYVGMGTVIGARLGHCLFYDFDYYRHHWLEIVLPLRFNPDFKITGYAGLASHGGAVGILIALLAFSKKYGLSFLWLADRLALVVPFAGCCIRLGNLMNSEIIGKPTNVPWAFVFVSEDMQPRHPAQLYEAMAYLLIGLILFRTERRKSYANGFLLGCFLALVFSARFLIEFTKENQSAFEAGVPFNMGQLLSLPLIITGVWLLVKKTKNLDSGRSIILK